MFKLSKGRYLLRQAGGQIKGRDPWDGLHHAFSHSDQCDGYLGASAMESVDTGKLLPGGEVEHIECACWCHSQGFDRNAPPEGFEELNEECLSET